MPKCPFCGSLDLVPRYRSIQDHPGYEYITYTDEDGEEMEGPRINGKPIAFFDRGNNTWSKAYPGSPYRCNPCNMAVFIDEDYEERVKRDKLAWGLENE